MTETPDRCSFELEPAAWEETHSDCFVEEDEDILSKTADGTVAWQCPHQAIKGENLCQFHLPTDANAKPNADTIADEFVAIVNGNRPVPDDDGTRPARFIGAKFGSLSVDVEQLGDGRCIDLRHSEISRAELDDTSVQAEPFDARGMHVRGEWNCSDSSFTGQVQFKRAVFEDEVRFNRTEFNDILCIQTKFDERTWFVEAEFGNRPQFNEAKFAGSARFDKAYFSGRALFDEVRFAGAANFDGTKFNDGAQFQEVNFGKTATFMRIKCDDGIRFNKSEFSKAVWLDEAEFEAVTCNQAKFDEEAWFAACKFGGPARFDHAEFGGRAWFAGATFDRKAQFRGVKFSESAVFYEATFSHGAVFTAEGWYPISPFQDDANFSDITADAPVQFIDEHSVDKTKMPYTFLGTADFSGVVIPNAEFSDVSFSEDPTFDNADLSGADMSDIPLDGATFEGSDLIRTELSEASVTNATFNGAVLERGSLYGTDFRNARLYGARLAGAHISDHTDWGIRDVSEQRISLIPFKRPRPAVRYDPRNPEYDQYADDQDKQGGAAISDYSRAASVYAEIQRVAETNAASDLASRCFRWRKDMQRKRYGSDEGSGNNKQRTRRIWAEMSHLVARYGDSPWRVLGTSIVTVVLFGVLYPFFGGMQSTGDDGRVFAFDTLVTIPELPTWMEVAVSNLYFSAVTFTTLGYGDIRPSGPVSQALASIESFLGAALLALLVAVLARRITR